MVRGHWPKLALILVTASLACCSTGPRSDAAPPGQFAGTASLPGPALAEDVWVGRGVLVENLTVFPVFTNEPRDLGEFTTLAKAIQLAKAEVREVGSDRESSPALQGGSEFEQQAGGDAARVDTLVIENRGELPILVLAGTIVKGGKQDRQIGEDFVVPAKQTVDVSAFCVEQGRWNGTREGSSTGGRFTAQATLATGKVRAAGQYDKDQSAVWKQVEQATDAHDKKTASGTLLAAVDDADLSARRVSLSRAAAGALEAAGDRERLVGLAYAVDGEVRGVRWFAGPKLFRLFEASLLETAAFEAITSQAEARAAGKPSTQAVAAKEDAVISFADDMMRAPVSTTEAEQGQRRALKASDEGYASELLLDALPGTDPKRKGKPPKAITVDMLKK